MAKKKTGKKQKVDSPKVAIQEVHDSRNGGQIALKGYSYQLLYSSYLILSESDENTEFYFEGIEDLDQVKQVEVSNSITHIQIKYSTIRQNASFLSDVLKNFLEIYLLDNVRNFKLVFDFSVAKGHMSKLFESDLDEQSTLYWKSVVEKIKSENFLWNWNNFSFEDFVSKLSFEKVERNYLIDEIEKKLIQEYDITTENVKLFANAFKICCLNKMVERSFLNKREVDVLVQDVKDDINKGTHNPAYKWIKKIFFDKVITEAEDGFYEGKKPTVGDIVSQLPVRRPELEEKLAESIEKNRVTVIKASSGQGKTTLAFQVAYNLRDEFDIYRLIWCNDPRELSNIVQFLASRVRLGEKPLILIDNVDSQLSGWNGLAQLLQEEVIYHYKLLLTVREDDWYSYAGDLSNIKLLHIVKPTLNEREAQSIFEALQRVNKIHPSIYDWRKSWVKVANRKLLIEYIYLLTHGEMLSERISHQLEQINSNNTGKIKCDILRKVCFADTCGIKLSVDKLVKSLPDTAHFDYGEILKSIENEFLIRVDNVGKYVEGLHPVRSQHIVDKLHDFIDISDTALQVVQIADHSYFAKLFSNLPKVITNKHSFYSEVIDSMWNGSDLSHYVFALQGVFSGSIMQYFLSNRHAFDDANEHGGLFILDMELNPFTNFHEFDFTSNAMDELLKIDPNNPNIQYLRDLRDSIPKIDLPQTDVYHLCIAIFNQLKDHDLFDITSDVESYSKIMYWLYNINPALNLSKNVPLDKIWEGKNIYSEDSISSIMYTCFCGDRELYLNFVNKNISSILSYLKASTESLRVYVKDNDIFVEYILLPSNIRNGNDESVSRLKTICKMLPIFEKYHTVSLKPRIEMLSNYNIPDDSLKTMPIRNLFIMFHQEFNSLWSKTIMSNYECDSIIEWLEYWFSARITVVELYQKSITCINKILKGEHFRNVLNDIDSLRVEMNRKLIMEFRFPYEDRPFDVKASIPEGFVKVKNEYFQSVRNFFDQLSGFLSREPHASRLAIINLRAIQSSLEKMQTFFQSVAEEQCNFIEKHDMISMLENQRLLDLQMECSYYEEHQPSRFFDKFQVSRWYFDYHKSKLEIIKQALSGISVKHSIIFPDRYYYEKTLSYYPVVVSNLDTYNGSLLTELLCQCIPFADFEFDYLVLLEMNDQGKILQTALKVPKSLLKKLKEAIDNNDTSQLEELTPPYLIEISSQMLGCFDNQFEVHNPIFTGYEGVDNIAELLWAYSKSREILTKEIESEYWNKTEHNYRKEVLKILESIIQKIPKNDYDRISNQCHDVFDGNLFDDVSFNSFFNELATKLMMQYQ